MANEVQRIRFEGENNVPANNDAKRAKKTNIGPSYQLQMSRVKGQNSQGDRIKIVMEVKFKASPKDKKATERRSYVFYTSADNIKKEMPHILKTLKHVQEVAKDLTGEQVDEFLEEGNTFRIAYGTKEGGDKTKELESVLISSNKNERFIVGKSKTDETGRAVLNKIEVGKNISASAQHTSVRRIKWTETSNTTDVDGNKSTENKQQRVDDLAKFYLDKLEEEKKEEFTKKTQQFAQVQPQQPPVPQQQNQNHIDTIDD